MKFYAQILHSGKLVPENDSDYEVYKKLRKNVTLSFDVKQERNPQFHKKFFALLNMVFDNQEIFEDVEQMRRDLTIEAGFYNEYRSFRGEIKKEAKSISFAKMDQIEFDRFYDKFADAVIRVFEWDSEAISENLESYL